MAGSTTTTLNDLLPSIVAEAMFVANERSIMRGLVKNYTLAAGQGKTVTVPVYPQVTAAAITEGDLITNSEVSTSGATLTVATNAIRTMVSDLSVAGSSSNVVADLGRLFGEAIARKIDKDLTALFAGFSAGEGDYTTAITAESIFKSAAKLRGQGIDPAGMVCVLHPEVAFDLKKALTTNGNVAFTAGAFGNAANEAMVQGYVGMLAGIPIFETSNIDYVTNAGDFPGAVFHRDALGLAMIGDVSIETARRIDYLSTEVVASCHYGVGELQDGLGRFLKYDSSI
ncbi:Phage capsid [uncultured Caudovirales phage]|uniref:Phage capsid n=1 Tax=uncultured Caudovirales phage TaxID=2100421 RepID=A0A6J7XAG7_9CAUD|nr:Phage capsid [uncultured Caudovirales phage]